ncbi:MAG: adenylate/guanylate cyclase domain-containing protein [Alphaproteobacteria bacterium]|nr:adenylate/guanylate cyclase domain-containing protein [Alphaproteobacteria bacterium]
MGSAEEDTIARQKAHRSELFDPLISAHHGRIVKTTGDGLLVEFASVVDAVKCAVAVQKGIAEREAELPQEHRIQYRMGINLGDIVINGDDILGDGVNVAARLEGLAEPSGICVSATVHEHVGDRLPIGFADLGELKVKNIARPIRAYKVLAANETSDTASPGTAEVMLKRPAVAVLPFANMSGDAEQEYFSDGLTEEIITALALWRSFPVIARNSSFAYKGKAVDVKQIGRELEARYVLEGSVRRSGNRVRVTAQLIDTTGGHHVWVEKLEGELDDVFLLQDELTHRIAANLEPAIGKAELAHSRAKPPDNLDAWDYFLRGRSRLHEFTHEGHVEARKMFTRAIELNPNYCEAFANLAWTYSRDLLLEYTEDRKGSIAKLHEAARQAVALNDESSLAHHLLSTAYLWRDELDLAIAEGRRAVALNPSDADSRHALGNKLDLVGDAEGIVLMEQAQRLNPKDPQRHMQLSFLARAYLNAGRYEESVETARTAVQWRPDYPNAHYVLAVGLGHLDREKEARAELDECERLHPGFVEIRKDWRPYRDANSNQNLREGRRKAGLA